MTTFLTQLKRYVYNWARPSMTDKNFQKTSMPNKNDAIIQTFVHTDDQRDVPLTLQTFFLRPFQESSWKGENETINCLDKVMKTIDKYPYHVVKGYVQSGKSQLMIYYSAWMAHVHKMNVVIMLRNQTADIKSIADKFALFKKEKNNKDLEVVQFSSFYNSHTFQDVVNKFKEQNKVFLILGNAEQLNKLNQVVEHQGIRPFVMCIDELDLNEKQESTRFYTEFDQLKQSGIISHILGVTGTCLPVLFKRITQLTTEQVVSLKAPLNYKGIQNITFTEIDINDEGIVEKTMEKMMKSAYAFYDRNGIKHPAILLVKDERVKTNQMNMMMALQQNRNINKEWVTIVYNGDGTFVRMPSSDTIVNHGNKSINDCLKELKDTYGNSIKYIAIISGDLANRGLSFVSADYTWHLTHMILCARPSSSGSNLMQYSRLCGCYNDDIPLEMFTSKDIQQELFAYDNLQEKCLEQCEDPLLDVEGLKARLSKMKLDPSCVVRRPVDTNLKVKYECISNFDNKKLGRRLNATTIEEALEICKKDYNARPKIAIKKIKLDMAFNEENVKQAKQYVNNVLDIQKYINVLKTANHINIVKNPFYITDTRKKSKAFIVNNNGRLELYIRQITNDNISYNELFLFETPSGIYVARNIDCDQLQQHFVEYTLRL